MRKKLFFAVLSLVFFSACKKDDAASLKGQWNIDNILTKHYQGTTLVDSDVVPGAGATVNFKDNGQVVISSPGEPDETSTYAVSGTTITVNGDSGEIQNLTKTSVTIFTVEDYGGGEREESYMKLTR